MTISIPVNEIEQPERADTGGDLAKLKTLNLLARELIEDRPTEELFGFIVDRVLEHTAGRRAPRSDFSARTASRSSTSKCAARTAPTPRSCASATRVLSEVVEEKKALAFMDVSMDEKLSRAQSIIMQGIRSILCAPLMIGDSVVGVLYVDYLFNAAQDLRG